MAHRRIFAVAAGRGALHLTALASLGLLFGCGPERAAGEGALGPAEPTPAAELYLPPAAEVYTPPAGKRRTSAATRSTAATVSPTPTASPTPTGRKIIVRRTVTENRRIPFRLRTVHDPTMARGRHKVVTQGATGIRTLVYEVTYVNGIPARKRLVLSVVTKAPVTRITAIGTRDGDAESAAISLCDPHPSYTGCVPKGVPDVDCAHDPRADGPVFIATQVKVIGPDVYGLDKDGDRLACEPDGN